ncbi:hypothetical protein [Sphaerisporangium aureirubrum]|uniref:Uncharacterized protein n=1 Tax=Sphaerisporangium aureirubrum TaxID=1544736 RepID=A0ABW1NP34_9ACTN
MTEPNDAVNPEIEPEEAEAPDVVAHSEDDSEESPLPPPAGWCGVHQSKDLG